MPPDDSTRRQRSARTHLNPATDSRVAERIELLHADAVDWCAREASGASHSAAKSIVLDLAYEEFCLRTQAGEPVRARSFATSFPGYESSLCRLLEVHEAFAADPTLLPTSVAWPAVGECFLGFRLVEKLGEGSFARVYMAEELELSNRRVVVKITSAGSGEAELLANLEHDHIVPVNSVKTDPKQRLSLLCMPFLGRATLCDVLDRRLAEGFPANGRQMSQFVHDVARGEPQQSLHCRQHPSAAYVNWVIKLGIEIAGALEHTHAQNICHSDLKPSNILLAENESAMLLDFNLSFQGQSQRVGGTVHYMSPEQLRAVTTGDRSSARDIGPQTDIFSVGVILHELLTGELPFGNATPDTSASGFCQKALASQEELSRVRHGKLLGVDRRFASVIDACLAFDPAERPSAGELGKQLQRSLSRLGCMRRWTRCHRVRAVYGALVAALVVVAAWGVQSQIPSHLQKVWRQAQAAYAAGDYQATVHGCNEILAVEPRSPVALFLRGRANEGRKEYTLALSDYDDCDVLLGDARLKACRGVCYQQKQYFDVAAMNYEQALENGFATANMYSNMAYCYLQMAKLPEAIQCCNEAIKLDPALQQPFEFRAAARRNFRGQLEPVPVSAAEDMLHAIELGPQSARIYLSAAEICAAVAVYDESWLVTARELTFAAMARGTERKHVTDRLCQSFLDADPERLKNLKFIPAPDPAPRVLPVLPDEQTSLTSTEAY